MKALFETYPVIEKTRPPLLGSSRDIDSGTNQVQQRRPADVADREIAETVQAIFDKHMYDRSETAAA